MDFIVLIIGQVYERFMMRLKDLKLCIQVNAIKQVIEVTKCYHDT